MQVNLPTPLRPVLQDTLNEFCNTSIRKILTYWKALSSLAVNELYGPGGKLHHPPPGGYKNVVDDSNAPNSRGGKRRNGEGSATDRSE